MQTISASDDVVRPSYMMSQPQRLAAGGGSGGGGSGGDSGGGNGGDGGEGG